LPVFVAVRGTIDPTHFHRHLPGLPPGLLPPPNRLPACQEVHHLLQTAATLGVVLLSQHQARLGVREYLIIPLLDDVEDALLLLS